MRKPSRRLIVSHSIRFGVLSAALVGALPDITRAGGPVVYSWSGGSVDSPSWLQPYNWDQMSVPTGNVTVYLGTSGQSPRLDSNISIGTIHFNNMTFYSGGGYHHTLTATNEMTFDGTGSSHFYLTDLENQGNAFWNTGAIITSAAPVITNTGVFNVQCDESLYPYFYPKAQFNNSGLLRKVASAGSSYINADFSNTGTVLVSTGSLSMIADNYPVNTGSFLADSGATLRMGKMNFATGANFAGDGNMHLVEGNLISGTATVRSGNLKVVEAGNYISGTVVINDGASFDLASGGGLTGTGVIRNPAFPGAAPGEFRFTGGNLFGDTTPGVGSLVNQARMRITGPDFKQISNGRFTNEGYATWEDGLIYTNNQPTINNSGVMELQGDNTLVPYFYPQSLINNSGTWRKSAGAGTSSVNADFSNTGTVIADTGVLVISAADAPHSNGTFISNAGTVRLSGLHFDNQTNFRGSGTTQWDAGNVVDGSIDIATGAVQVVGAGNHVGGTIQIADGATLDLATGGSLRGNGRVQGDGEFLFTGGTIFGWDDMSNNTLVNAAHMRIAGTDLKQFSNGRFTNDGVISWEQGPIYTNNQSTFNNAGVFDVQNDNSWVPYFYPMATINNSGTWMKSAGAGTAHITANFNNSGTVIAESGVLSINGTDGPVSTGTFISNGAASVRLTGQNLHTGANFRGSGTTQLDSSNTVVGSINIAAGGVQVMGPANVIAGTVSIASGAAFDLAAGGEIRGSGVIQGAGEFRFTGGTLRGPIGPSPDSLRSAGNMHITGPELKQISDGRFTNAGSAIWDDGPIYTNFAPTIDNTGVMDLQSDNVLVPYFYPPATINNSGTWKKTAGAGGASTISAVFNNTGSLLVSAGSMTFGQDFVTTGTFTVSPGADVRFSGASTTLDGVQNWPDGYVLPMNGTTNFASDAGYAGPKLDLQQAGGALHISSTQHLRSLSIIGGSNEVTPGGDKVLVTQNLSIYPYSTTLDLTDNDMVVDYDGATPLPTIQAQIFGARNYGAWDGYGITSSTARDHVNRATTLGVLEGAEYTAMTGATDFSGETIDDTSVLVKYTWYGDTDFNGGVDFDDYVRVDAGYNSGLSGWANGDTNLDGVVDFDDYVVVDLAYNVQNNTLMNALNWLEGEDRSNLSAPGVTEVAQHFAQFGTDYANAFYAAVPEPTTIAMVPLIGTLGLRRRRL